MASGSVGTSTMSSTAAGIPPRSSHLARVRVALARRAVRGGQRADLEVGVIGQQLDEALAHGARRAEDTDFDFVGFHVLLSP